eukprot:CAMPEP_0179193218 /NCGR_PEP_ID=MMETSP0796-20121207/96014_1 /TAXON_ID=73915 /ORGANISM="Pyrodinium bahamense, Strain pbaha01" /LENGTH=50 /DNA_ID=CAMNT_0020897517 /DNA_START=100 /DNA_END=252 /DNA_ORIENTATION=-
MDATANGGVTWRERFPLGVQVLHFADQQLENGCNFADKDIQIEPFLNYTF